MMKAAYVVVLLAGIVELQATSITPILQPGLTRKPVPRTKLKIRKERIAPFFNNLKGGIVEKDGNYIFTWENGKKQKKQAIYTPANKIDPIVISNVRSDLNGQNEFSYYLLNAKTSTQKLSRFWIKEDAGFIEARGPKDWLVRKRQSHQTGKMFSGDWRIFSGMEKYAIKPGDHINNIFISSKGMPGIVDCYIEGYNTPLIANGEMPQEVADAIDSLSEYAGFVGLRWKTMGPIPIKEPIDPISHLSNISDMIDESLKLGWIDNIKTKNILKTFIEKAKALIDAKELDKAKVEMRKAIAFVEEWMNKTVTSEVQAIVKFNLEFLIQRIH